MSIENIPVIDITRLERARPALEAACREWGFFQVVRHGIDDGVIQTLHREMRDFFYMEAGAKAVIARTAENPWGFFDRELTKNTLDWKQIYDYGPAAGAGERPQWPTARPDFKPAILAFYQACEHLALRLLAALSTNLGMPADYLNRCFQPSHTSFLRLNYYPVCPQPARPAGCHTPANGHLGLNHHTDAGALTLLLQDRQPGLEVFKDEAWHLVEPRDDALVINIGDIVQVWSNDRYEAALHRVVASTTSERFSAPFFFNPSYSTNYAPLPSTVDHMHPPRYRSINWQEFRARRAAGDYADEGEEIQISHYRHTGASLYRQPTTGSHA
jgi:isopenicillin N synthase-like dioxygenase